MRKHLILSLVSIAIICFSLLTVQAQQTSFTYQGKLNDGGSSANGRYDLQFALFDSPIDGAQVGATQTVSSVTVSGGIFTASLDFGANAFPGANRFLEISARLSGAQSFTPLTPRQPITATPYALRSLNSATADKATDAINATNATNATNAVTANNAQQLAGVAASQYVLTGDARLSDVRTPTAGSASYIQNATAQQATSNFNISGDGTAGGTLSGNSVNAKGRFTLNGETVLRTAESPENLLVGIFAGGSRPGRSNTFVGFDAGSETVAGDSDSENTFVGYEAGGLLSHTHAHGLGNTLLGTKTKVGDAVSNATAIGANAAVDRSDSLVLGNNVNVGIGVTAPQFKLHVIDGSNKGLRAETGSPGGTVASFGGFGEFQIDAPGLPAGRLNVKENGSVILGDCPGCFPNVTDRLVVSGTARIVNLGSGGSISLCRNGSAQISACSSSIRYKSNIADWRRGLNLINRLRPVTFDWKDTQAHDFGLVAEEVAAAEPLLVTRNEKGEVEGVKYDRLSAVFINAFKEQQAQIERQQAEIDRLKKIVCASRRRALGCK